MTYHCIDCKGCEDRIGTEHFSCTYRRTEQFPEGEPIQFNVRIGPVCKEFMPREYIRAINFCLM